MKRFYGINVFVVIAQTIISVLIIIVCAMAIYIYMDKEYPLSYIVCRIIATIPFLYLGLVLFITKRFKKKQDNQVVETRSLDSKRGGDSGERS